MQTWSQKYISASARQWEEAMAHTDNFSAEIRSKTEVDRHADGTADSYDCTMGKDMSRVTAAMERIKAHGYLNSEMTALDIGSGTGAFTIPFAKAYARVTSLDISPKMQEIIRNKADAERLRNIDYVGHNWHTVDLKAVGMAQKYDLVLSSLNTRGIYNQETLMKMNQASRGGCCMVSFTGGGKKNHGPALNNLILGRQLQTAGGNDIIMPFQMIYHMGGQPELTYSQIAWDRSFTAAQAVDTICSQFWRFAEITTELRERIAGYVADNLEEDGLYHERAQIPVGIMVWDARRVRAYMSA